MDPGLNFSHHVGILWHYCVCLTSSFVPSEKLLASCITTKTISVGSKTSEQCQLVVLGLPIFPQYELQFHLCTWKLVHSISWKWYPCFPCVSGSLYKYKILMKPLYVLLLMVSSGTVVQSVSQQCYPCYLRSASISSQVINQCAAGAESAAPSQECQDQDSVYK